MITIFASIVGFIGSMIPEILKYLKDNQDKQHELNILDRQIIFNKNNKANRLEEIESSRDILEQSSLYSTYKTGVSWVDALNGTVRPVLAYSFFMIYAFVKLAQYKTINNSEPLVAYIDIIWSIEDQAIFAGIISFYFGQRNFSKFWRK